MIRRFITCRLNFYRFKWWRRLAGIPEPRPLTPFEQELNEAVVDALSRMKACVDRDSKNFWMDCKTGQKINVKRPQRYKPPHKDRYL